MKPSLRASNASYFTRTLAAILPSMSSTLALLRFGINLHAFFHELLRLFFHPLFKRFLFAHALFGGVFPNFR